VTILLVDDDSVILDVLGLLLTDLGHEVQVASSGADALLCLDKTKPDLVMSDLHMPDLDGLALLQAVHQRYAELPVVLMTGYGTVETAVEALRGRAFDYLKKPIELADLQACLERVQTKDD